MLRVVLFTTPTKHHTYFINKLRDVCQIDTIFYERKRLVKDYPTGPFFAEEEDAFEDRFFDPAFGGTDSTLDADLDTKIVSVHSLNQVGLCGYLNQIKSDIGISFGVGKISEATFSAPRLGTINVHRGLTQYHRGLDSDLWAIHQERFDQIGVTIHQVAAELDTGVTLRQDVIPIGIKDEIYHIRYKTSIMATEMVMDILREAEHADCMSSAKPLTVRGDYFTAMSLAEKRVAAERFTRHKIERSGDDKN